MVPFFLRLGGDDAAGLELTGVEGDRAERAAANGAAVVAGVAVDSGLGLDGDTALVETEVGAERRDAAPDDARAAVGLAHVITDLGANFFRRNKEKRTGRREESGIFRLCRPWKARSYEAGETAPAIATDTAVVQAAAETRVVAAKFSSTEVIIFLVGKKKGRFFFLDSAGF